MSNFDVYAWKETLRSQNRDKKYLTESVTIDVPENTGYEDLARAVADVLINDYGTHNFQPFLKTLSSLLNQSGVEEGKKVDEALSVSPVEQAESIVQKLRSNVSTNSNIPTQEKQVLLSAFDRLAALLDELGYEIEAEVDKDLSENALGRAKLAHEFVKEEIGRAHV